MADNNNLAAQRKIKIVIADQQPMFRKGLEYFLSQATDIEIIAEASTEGDLVNSVVTQIPDVVLLDISLASDGMDLARVVSCREPYAWRETEWSLGAGYGQQERAQYHVVAYDYGIKRNILRRLTSYGCHVTVVPTSFPAEVWTGKLQQPR